MISIVNIMLSLLTQLVQQIHCCTKYPLFCSQPNCSTANSIALPPSQSLLAQLVCCQLNYFLLLLTPLLHCQLDCSVANSSALQFANQLPQQLNCFIIHHHSSSPLPTQILHCQHKCCQFNCSAINSFASPAPSFANSTVCLL